MDKKNISSRSSMQVALLTRFVSVTITVFILLLTVKSELLEYKIIAWQLVLAIPLLFTALIMNSKIVSMDDLKEHRYFNIIITSVAFAMIFNTLGLLVARYISAVVGTMYFVLFISCYSYFLIRDWKNGKIHNEIIIITILVLFGLLPALFILS